MWRKIIYMQFKNSPTFLLNLVAVLCFSHMLGDEYSDTFCCWVTLNKLWLVIWLSQNMNDFFCNALNNVYKPELNISSFELCITFVFLPQSPTGRTVWCTYFNPSLQPLVVTHFTTSLQVSKSVELSREQTPLFGETLYGPERYDPVGSFSPSRHWKLLDAREEV